MLRCYITVGILTTGRKKTHFICCDKTTLPHVNSYEIYLQSFPLEALPSFKVNWVCWTEFERVCMFLIFNHWDIEVILERISLLEIKLSSLTYYLMQIVPTISFSNDAIERMKIWKSDIFKSHSELSDLDKMETDEWWLDKARQSWADWFFVEEFSWINWKIQWPHHPYQYW